MLSKSKIITKGITFSRVKQGDFFKGISVRCKYCIAYGRCNDSLNEICVNVTKRYCKVSIRFVYSIKTQSDVEKKSYMEK